MTTKLTLGVHHVGLAVRDLEEARGFFCDTLGFDLAGGNPDYPSVFVTDGASLITLWQVADPEAAIGFDRRNNVGLHHLALRVADDAALEQLYVRIASCAGAQVEFAPEPMREGSPVKHFI